MKQLYKTPEIAIKNGKVILYSSTEEDFKDDP